MTQLNLAQAKIKVRLWANLSRVVATLTSDDECDPAPISNKCRRSVALDAKEPLIAELLPDPSITELNDIDDPNDKPLNRTNATADIKRFFMPAPHMPGQPKILK